MYLLIMVQIFFDHQENHFYMVQLIILFAILIINKKFIKRIIEKIQKKTK